ncbi:hypothetical protein ACFQPA_07685 [Halomarina halobia]|uniref:Uncharacterized protein n=1 Tax=Halomarina halobia TaxID=3033386 RepID=A0ABD6ACV1_9EURY|nr:hypothetical protein [Halomarina sp. PSR21]
MTGDGSSDRQSGTPPYGKSLPAGADGDNSIVIDNGVYRVDIGETESGTWVWDYNGHSTLYHEFFAMSAGGNRAVPSFDQDEVLSPFPDNGEPGGQYAATTKYTVEGVPVVVKRSVQMDPDDPTFRMTYDIVNSGGQSLEDFEFYQYADFDDGRNDFWDDVGVYRTDPQFVYVRDGGGNAYAGFGSNLLADEHLVDDYPGYSEVLNGNMDNDDRYPTSGTGDAVVALNWEFESLIPGQPITFTLRFGAASTEEEIEQTAGKPPEDLDTTPPRTEVSAMAGTLAYVPGLSENDAENGNDNYSIFPNGKSAFPPRDFSPDGTFLGDSVLTPVGLDDLVGKSKSVQELDGSYRAFRFRNHLAISFNSPDGRTIPSDETVQMYVNGEFPDDVNIHNTAADDPEFELDYFLPGDPDRTSNTILEEGILHNDLHPIGRNPAFDSRTRRAHAHRRFFGVEKRTFYRNGETVDGVRAATIWGTSNPYTRYLARDLLADIGDLILDFANPIIYSWVELSLLADGTKLVRVPDASVFPKQAGVLANHPDLEEGSIRERNNLEVLLDVSKTSNDDAYEVATNEKHNAAWQRFQKEFKEQRVVPYGTPHLDYLFNYEANWDLADHPVMVYGELPDGTHLDTDQVHNLLDSATADTRPLSPFPVG